MNEIIESAIGLAQHHHPVVLMGYVVMGNHVHFEFLVENPDDIRGFMERFKTETGHAINRRYGRRQRSVWCAGYDCVTILTKEDMVRKQIYHYTNPTSADLVESIRDYPGVSSWQMLAGGISSKTVKRIRRPDVRHLTASKSSNSDDNQENNLTITIQPFAWRNSFDEERTEEELREELVKQVTDREAELRKERLASKRKVLGKRALIAQSPFKKFSPKKFGRRMWCICHDKELRKSFIAKIKHLRESAREVLALWRLGDTTKRYPLGLFAPTFPRVANAMYPFPMDG